MAEPEPETIGIHYEWPEQLPEPEENHSLIALFSSLSPNPIIAVDSVAELEDCIDILGTSFRVNVDQEFPPRRQVFLKILAMARVYEIEVASPLPIESDPEPEQDPDPDPDPDPDQEQESESEQEEEENPESESEHEEEENPLGSKVFSDIAQKRILVELEAWLIDPPLGFHLQLVDLDERWTIEVHGAPGTLYANEICQLQVDFPANYPFEAPQVMFLPQVPLNPFIYSDGHIDLATDWLPTMTVSSLCTSILDILSSCTVKASHEDDDNHLESCRSPEKKEMLVPR